MYKNIQGVLFDKDGTLFDFQSSWGAWFHDLIDEMVDTFGGATDPIAEAMGFDRKRRRFRAESTVIAETLDETIARLDVLVPGAGRDALRALARGAAERAVMQPAVPLLPLLTGLRARGLALGVATNETEGIARAQLSDAGIAAAFDYIAGCDSGHGAKPDPGMCRAFATDLALDPGSVLMVGDSLHDLRAGAAAGMRPIAVLSGVADADELAPHAEVVLRDIGALPEWIAQNGGRRP